MTRSKRGSVDLHSDLFPPKKRKVIDSDAEELSGDECDVKSVSEAPTGYDDLADVQADISDLVGDEEELNLAVKHSLTDEETLRSLKCLLNQQDKVIKLAVKLQTELHDMYRIYLSKVISSGV